MFPKKWNLRSYRSGVNSRVVRSRAPVIIPPELTPPAVLIPNTHFAPGAFGSVQSGSEQLTGSGPKTKWHSRDATRRAKVVRRGERRGGVSGFARKVPAATSVPGHHEVVSGNDLRTVVAARGTEATTARHNAVTAPTPPPRHHNAGTTPKLTEVAARRPQLHVTTPSQYQWSGLATVSVAVLAPA